MVTRKNYVEKMEEIGIENLPKEFLKVHEWYMENQHLYSKFIEVKEAVDIYLDRLNIHLQKGKLSKEGKRLLENKISVEIAIIKKYVDLVGRQVTLKQVKDLVIELQSAIRNKEITKDSKYVASIRKIQIKLINAFNKRSKKISLNVPAGELHHLKSIIKDEGNKLKNRKKGLGTIYKKRKRGIIVRRCLKKTFSDAIGKGTCSHNRGLAGVMTAEQVANQTFELLPFSGQWSELIGKPEKNFTMMIHGEPGSGKSTFLMKFSKYLANFGKLLYLTSEEFGSVTLTSKVNEYLNPLPPNIEFASDLASLKSNDKEISDYDFVILDSVTDLGLCLEDFKTIKKKNPRTAFILVLQHTKDGNFRGGKEWEHEAQIAGSVSEGVITIYKNRYGIKGEMNFFNDLI